MARYLIVRLLGVDDVQRHKFLNFAWDVERKVAPAGLAEVLNMDSVWDRLRIKLSSPRHKGAVRMLLEKELVQQHLVAEVLDSVDGE